MALISTLFAGAQALLGARAVLRMAATAAGDPIQPVAVLAEPSDRCAVIVPVLDEAQRLGALLGPLVAQPGALQQIIIVDGGSTDGTQAIVRRYAARDPRVTLVDASPVGTGWNGKAWNLAAGLAATDPAVRWIVTVDADVRPEPHFITSLLAHARGAFVDAFSAAPRFVLSGDLEAVVHPAFLATLVYRYGLPGNVAQQPRAAQANGQCFVAKREWLVRTDAFAAARTSPCEDVTVARHLIARGAQVGFFEGGALASVAMYESARDCWQQWPRSLPLRDAQTSTAELALAFAEIVLVQALPLAVVAALVLARAPRDSLVFRVNLGLACVRLGVLAGMHRAYERPSATYWLSPLADLPAVAALGRSLLVRRHVWRGRRLVPLTPHSVAGCAA